MEMIHSKGEPELEWLKCGSFSAKGVIQDHDTITEYYLLAYHSKKKEVELLAPPQGYSFN